MSDRRNHSWSPATTLIVVLIGSVACSVVTTYALNRPWWPSDPTPPTPEPRSVRISRSDLFPGDLKRLAPHLGLAATGCVHFDVTGSDWTIGMEVESYQKGKPRSLGSSWTPHKHSGEVSISLREVTDPNGKLEFQIVMAFTNQSESGSWTSRIEAPDGGRGVSNRSTTYLRASGSRDLAEGERVAVWAHTAYEDVRQMRPADSLVDEAKQGKWAVVLWVWWEEIKGH
ncbi:MAG: hypothetical protein JWO38_4584 [Gemmataceae bacterium]|nr:hypothetical protein [Gemmataceae bacterium]